MQRAKQGVTRTLPHSRDPFTGQVSGIKISTCLFCGQYPSTVGVATGLCGRAGCEARRKKAHEAKQ